MSADAAVGCVAKARSLFVHSGCGEPQTLVEALIRNRGHWRNLRILSGLQGAGGAYTDPQYADHFRPELFMVNKMAWPGLSAGTCAYIPCSLSGVPELIHQVGLDAALVQVSPPDRHGDMSLGVTVAYTKAALASAKVVIAEINDQMPRTCGDTIVNEAQVDVLVEADRPVLEVPRTHPSTQLSAIGEAVVGLIPDEASVQVGIGAAAESSWAYLAQRPSLRVHTGSIPDAAIPMIEAQTGRRFPAVASQLIGSRMLYQFAHENPAIQLHQVNRTHDPRALAKIDRFVAINSAFEVDLRGQTNSETQQGRQVSASGGATDFAIAASLSEGGFNVIALSSVASDGSSRIVTRLPDGVVTLTGSLVDFVVTEHGIADLRTRTLAARAEALTGVAAPQHRKHLQVDQDRCNPAQAS